MNKLALKFIVSFFLINLLVIPFVNKVYADVNPIDKRIGVHNQAGDYPYLGKPFFKKSFDDIKAYGFSNYGTIFGPLSCAKTADYPNGTYQDTSHCSGTWFSDTLVSYAQKEPYRSLLDSSFNSLNLEAELVLDRINYQDGGVVIGSGTAMTQGQVDLLYSEFYQFTKYLLDRYKNNPKIIILESMNEMDWQVLRNKGLDQNANPDQVNLDNAVLFWNTVQNAIYKARVENTTSKLKVYHGCELNLVKKAINAGSSGMRTVLNDVVPRTFCDLYGYSAYEFLETNITESDFQNLLNYFQSKVTFTSGPYGSKNVYVSEVSVPENYGGHSPVILNDRLGKLIHSGLSWGVPYIYLWEIYDNNCAPTGSNTYTSSQNSCTTFGAACAAAFSCVGNYIIKPDGAPSTMYSLVQSQYSTPPVVATTECGSLDSTSDDTLGILDFQSFAAAYKQPCENDEKIWKSCGSKDVNNDKAINIIDFSHFAQRYKNGSCSV